MAHHTVHDPPSTSRTPAAERRRRRPPAREVPRSTGPAAAVVLAAGLASFTLGLLSVLTAASTAASDALTLSERVGDASGLTTAAGVVFFAAWAGLALVWRGAGPRLGPVAATAAGLIALGLLGTFPPLFNAVGG